MSSNSPYSMSLFCMGTKSHHQALLSQFLGLIGASFHYLENVGKYNVACQTNQSLEVLLYSWTWS